jgi:hypothetical protein
MHNVAANVLVMASCRRRTRVFAGIEEKVDPCLVGAYRMFRSYQGLLKDLNDWLLRRTRHANANPLADGV